MFRKMDVQPRRLHAGDAGDILPVVLFQLPQHKIVAQIDEPNPDLPLFIQGSPGQAGDGLGRQRLLIPVGEDHGLLPPVPALPQGPQPIRQLPADGNLPVRKHDGRVQKIHLLPGQPLDFIPHKPGLPGQAQDSARGVAEVLPQRPFHGFFIRTVDNVCLHGFPLSARL